MKKLRNTLINLLCLALLLTSISGICFVQPQKAQAADKVVQPITEYAPAGETTTWKTLWVFPLQTTAEGGTQVGDTLDSTVLNNLTKYIIPNFEAYIYEYSLHYMEIESTVITVPTVEAQPEEGYGHLVKCSDLEQAIKGTGVTTLQGTLANSLESYDQITCAWCPENTTGGTGVATYGFAGLGGPRFDGLKAGFNQIPIFSNTITVDNSNKNWQNADGTPKLHYYCTDLFVHEFMHNLEFYVEYEYPESIARDMPSPDGCWDYYTSKDGFDLMDDFYKYFFRGAVPVKKGSKSTFGLTPTDYKRPPSSYAGTEATRTITTLEQWNEMVIALSLGKKITTIQLGANIDATGQSIYTLRQFTGTLDGNGYAITGANLGANGLITRLEENSTVKNLTLIGAQVKAAKNSINTGLLVGQNLGTVQACGVTGTITTGTQSGALVGVNELTGTIISCFNGATATFQTTGGINGGITGYNAAGANGVKGCLNYGYILDPKNDGYGIVCSDATSCYTLKDSAANTPYSGTEEVTMAQLADGTVVTKLNKISNIWKQGDIYPVFKNAQYTIHSLNGGLTEASPADMTLWTNGTKGKIVPNIAATKWLNITTNSKGVKSVAKKSGTLKWICSDEPVTLAFNTTNHTLTTKSTSTKIAVTSAGVVTAKQPGRAYVYVADTGTFQVQAFAIDSKQAPAAIRTYQAETDDPKTGATEYKSTIVPAGGTVEFYVKGTVGSITKIANTMETLTDPEIMYSCEVSSAKQKDYVTIVQDEAKPSKFRVTVDENVLTTAKINNGKTLAITLKIKCSANTKTTTFKLVVGNPASQISAAAGENVTLDRDSATGVATVNLAMADTAKQTGKITVTTTPFDATRSLTGGLKIIKLPSADSYTYTNTGAVKAATALSASQKKVSLAATKGTSNSYTITAAKGTPGGTEAYFMLYNSDYQRENGKSHQIIRVVVGEANHVTQTTIAKREEYATTAEFEIEQSTGAAVISLDSALNAKQTIQLTEELTLANGDIAGTDGTTIYRLPSLTGFTVLPNKEMSVSGTLLAAQKKVTLTKKVLNKKTGEYCYELSAPKKTPEGTEAYFMIFHNSENMGAGNGYQLIKAVVGTPNHVSKINIAAGTGGGIKAVQNKTTKAVDVTINSAVSAKVTATITETTTVEHSGTATTDSTIIYRLPEADGYEWLANGTAQVNGVLTAAQKKITLAAKKGVAGTYTITAAKGTPAGTTIYFMLYHNNVKGESGTGYQIVKVTVG